MPTIEQLQKSKEKIDRQINALKNKEEKKKQPSKKDLVGKCFVYKNNSYSCPSKPSDYWDQYAEIVDAIESKKGDVYFIVKEFSIDSRKRMSLEIRVEYEFPPYGGMGWTEMDPVKFEKKWGDFWKEMLHKDDLKKRIREDKVYE